ncbi:MAG: DUF86 domain-containing protein [Chloroflexota bacterium]
MYDKTLALDMLRQIQWSTQTLLKRFRPIKSASDFLKSDERLEKLDTICMQLIAIGESLKNLEKVTDTSLLARYPEIDWSKVKGMRDVISHHYFDLDAEVVYAVCTDHIGNLAQAIRQMIADLESSNTLPSSGPEDS